MAIHLSGSENYHFAFVAEKADPLVLSRWHWIINLISHYPNIEVYLSSKEICFDVISKKSQ